MSKRSSTSAYRTDTDLRWRGADRTPQTRLLVVCGAAGTEPQYINALNAHLRNRAVHVKVVPKALSPGQVVDYGIKRATAADDSYDQLWCVVDVDGFKDLDAAAHKVANSPIPAVLVVSDPCFELWLLLHFTDHRGHIADAAHAKQLLRKHVPGYDKCRIEFAKTYAARIDVAVKNAQALDPTGEAAHLNPSTNVWRLVAAMRGSTA